VKTCIALKKGMPIIPRGLKLKKKTKTILADRNHKGQKQVKAQFIIKNINVLNCIKVLDICAYNDILKVGFIFSFEVNT
jgi:hypothetical protein